MPLPPPGFPRVSRLGGLGGWSSGFGGLWRGWRWGWLLHGLLSVMKMERQTRPRSTRTGLSEDPREPESWCCASLGRRPPPPQPRSRANRRGQQGRSRGDPVCSRENSPQSSSVPSVWGKYPADHSSSTECSRVRQKQQETKPWAKANCSAQCWGWVKTRADQDARTSLPPVRLGCLDRGGLPCSLSPSNGTAEMAVVPRLNYASTLVTF